MGINNPTYILDKEGNKAVSITLSLIEYQKILDLIEDEIDILEANKIKEEETEYYTEDEVKDMLFD